MEVQAFGLPQKSFHWLLQTRFSDLLCWTVVIDTMLKTGFGKKNAHTRFCKRTNKLCFTNTSLVLLRTADIGIFSGLEFYNAFKIYGQNK